MKRVLLAVGLGLLAMAVPRADVAPFPSWRLALNGYARTAHAGGVVYVGGDFTKVGRALPTFSARLDAASLSMTTLDGCARRGTTPLPGPYVDYPTTLADGAGPFVVPAGTVLVRIGPDCRFDRRFRVELPAGVSVSDPSQVAELGGRIYFYAYTAAPPSGTFAVYVVEADRVTGAVSQSWFMGDGSGVRIVGAAGGHVLVKEFTGTNGGFTLGWFDPVSGQVQPRRPLPNEWDLVHVGDVIVTRRSEPTGGVRLSAFDPVTLDPLPQWPVVHSDETFRRVVTSGGGRVFLLDGALTIDGSPSPRLVAFDAATGAYASTFTPPPWLLDAKSQVSMMAATASRLLVFGDFLPGAPRDTAAAFDATTGALDPWTWPYAAAPASTFAGGVYFPAIGAVDRVHREYLVAVDERTGSLLPWTPSPAPTAPVTAAAIEGTWLYAGRGDALRRYDLASGVEDASWGLDLQGAPWSIVLRQNTVYTLGYTRAASQRGAAAFVTREGGVAVTTSGTLTPWNPRLLGGCNAGRGTLPFPCVSELVAFDGHLIARGFVLRLLAPTEPSRSLMAIDPVTGDVDPFLPPVTAPVADMDVDGSSLYVVASVPGTEVLRLDASTGVRSIVSLQGPAGVAVHDGRLYAQVERDLATGVPTGNPADFTSVIAMGSGVASLAGWHADIAPIAPRTPTNLTGTVTGAKVTLTWNAGAGDLAPFAPAPPGGTAAMSHMVLASLTPGGPPVASIATASPDTTWSIDAPPGQYWLRVVAQNQFGVSAPSNEVAVLVSPAAPPRPTATRAVVTSGVVHIDWQAPIGGWPATSYLLDAGTAPGLTNIGTLPVNGTSFDAPVPPGRYYVRIRAVNSYGASVAGDEVVIDVP